MPRLNGTSTPRSIAASIDGSIRRPTLATRAAGWASARHGSARHASAAAQAALRLRNSSGGFIRAWRRRGRSLGEQCVADPRNGLPAEDARDERRGVDDAVERDAGLDAEAVEQEEHVLGRDVARRALRVRAAAEPGTLASNVAMPTSRLA